VADLHVSAAHDRRALREPSWIERDDAACAESCRGNDDGRLVPVDFGRKLSGRTFRVPIRIAPFAQSLCVRSLDGPRGRDHARDSGRTDQAIDGRFGASPVLTPDSLPRLQAMIAEQELDGWLLYDFKGRNPIASAVVGNWIAGTRRVFVKVPRKGMPIALIHEIDKELWLDWPKEWTKRVYIRREDLEGEVATLVNGERLALDYSPRGSVPYLDCVPAGLRDFLLDLGAELVPSIDLVTRFCSLWTPEDRASHVRAARRVAEIAISAMRVAGESSRLQEPMREYGLAVWIREAFDQAGLTTESGPSVSFGANAARNHYDPSGESSASLVPGQLLLIDLWAREPGGIYADQTWMAAIGAPCDRDAHLWQVVRQSRDGALDLLRQRVQTHTPVQGAELDRAAKCIIHEAGFGGNVASRTGHSIDRFGLHGFGPPIDDTETCDSRVLIPGVGFSVEPGIYLAGETGVRSEVNAWVGDGEVLITPVNYQAELVIL